MNRKFMVEPSPARARLLAMMARESSLVLDDATEELATRDRIPDDVLSQRGIDEPVDRAAVQFIADMNLRCGIPCAPEPKQFERVGRIVRAALEIMGEAEIASISPYLVRLPMSIKPISNDITVMTRYRSLPLVVDVSDECDLSLAGKFFPRIITIGRIRTQLAFTFGAERCTTTRMANILYPGCWHASQAVRRIGSREKQLLCMGMFPYLVER